MISFFSKSVSFTAFHYLNHITNMSRHKKRSRVASSSSSDESSSNSSSNTNSSDIIVSKRRQKKIVEENLRKRIESNIISEVGQNLSNTQVAPFKIWFKSYLQSIESNTTVWYDNDYNLIKNAIISRTIQSLPRNLQQKIKRNNIKVKKIDLINEHSIADRLPSGADDISYTKELVSIKVKNNVISNEPEGAVFSALHDQKESNYRIIVPVSKVGKIIERFHCNESIHVGADTCYKLINTYFQGVPRDAVRQFVHRCSTCQSRAIVSEKEKRRKSFLNPIEAEALFQRWEVDLCQLKDYEPAKQKFLWRYIVQVIDHKSKMRFAEVIPTKETKHVVEFLDRLMGTVGPPKLLQSDNGSEFTSEEYAALCEGWNVQPIYSSPRHPQTNGLVERGNRSLKKAINNWQRSNPQKDWASALRRIVHRLNCTPHTTIGIDPYYYVYGIKSWNELSFVQSLLNLKFIDEDDNEPAQDDEYPILDVHDGHNAESNALNEKEANDDEKYQNNVDKDNCQMESVDDDRGIHSQPHTYSLIGSITSVSSTESIVNEYGIPGTASTIESKSIAIAKPAPTLQTQPKLPVLPEVFWSHDEKAGVDEEEDTHISGENGLDICASANTDHRIGVRARAAATAKRKVELMVKNYNKKVKPKEYTLGDVVGLVVDAKWKWKQPTSNKVGNVPARIFSILRDPLTGVMKYQVRTKDYIIQESFRADKIVQLFGGAESYPKEYNWSISFSAIASLPKISFYDYFLKQTLESGAVIQLCTPAIAEDSSSAQKYFDHVCALCQELLVQDETAACKGCKSTIHRSLDQCKQSEHAVRNGSQIYCNIYCANVAGYYPTMPGYKDPNVYKSRGRVSEVNDASSVFIDPTFGVPQEYDNQVQSVLLASLDSVPHVASVSSSVGACYVCEDRIPDHGSFIKCIGCHKVLHLPQDCRLNVCYSRKGKSIYCSDHCCRRLISFETKIIDENPLRGYRVEWNTGNCRWVKKASIDSFYEHLRMILVWRRHRLSRETEPLHLFLEPSDSIPQPTSATPKSQPAADSAPSSSNPHSPSSISSHGSSVYIIKNKSKENHAGNSNSNEEDRCVSCGMNLDVSNWHRCAKCKRRNHGPIVCPKRQELFQDDDAFYCLGCSVSFIKK
jgi:hypothetical protein